MTSTRLIAATVAAAMTTMICLPPLHAQTRPGVDVWRAYAEKLDVTDLVRLRTRDGKSMKGYVVQVGDTALMVNPRTRVAEPLREIPLDQIVSIDRQREPRLNPAAKVLLGVGIGVGTFLLLSAIVLSSAYD